MKTNDSRHSGLTQLAACTLCATLAFVPQAARAFTIETAITRGCHEELTADALRATRSALPGTTAALPPRGDDRALIDDVAFTVPADLNDIGAVTLLLGVRDNDVKGIAAANVDQLAALNSNPGSQQEHCLREADQNEPTGSRAALDNCRKYIRETLLSALDGLDDQGRPDGTKRDRLKVTLALRGQIQVDVPTFYLRAGRGLHALEDSFTHTFRNVADRHKVTAVLNWIDYADNRLKQSVDGPAHMTELDRCDDSDALRTERHHLAIDAATAALHALLDPTLDHAAKARAIDAVIDRYDSFDGSGGCTADNQWCDAPELAYLPSGCGCAVLGARAPSASGTQRSLAFGALLYAGSRLRRKRRRTRTVQPPASPRKRSRWLAVIMVAWLAASLYAPTKVRAEGSSSSQPGVGGLLNALQGHSKAGTRGKEDTAGAWFGRVALGASYDKPGLAGGLGLRYQFNDALMFGFDAEWNPWITITPTRLREGAISTYFSIIRRFQLKNDSLNVRTTASLGASFLLTDLVGAPSGSVGPFIGLSVLGVEWKAAPGFYLTIDPAYIAFPVPHLTGVPFGYLQYRFQVGVEFGG